MVYMLVCALLLQQSRVSLVLPLCPALQQLDDMENVKNVLDTVATIGTQAAVPGAADLKRVSQVLPRLTSLPLHSVRVCCMLSTTIYSTAALSPSLCS
jgi:hypothetical protein